MNHFKAFACVLLLASLFIFSCGDDDPPFPTELTTYHFTGRINGDSLIYLEDGTDLNGSGFFSDKDSSRVGDDCFVTYEAQFRNLTGGTAGVYFTFNKFFEGPDCSLEPANFRTFFQLGDYDFIRNELAKGVIFQWVDGSQVIWSSQAGPQNNAIFSIETAESVPNDPNFGFSRHQVTGSLSCRLYNDNGDFVDLQNGQFSVYVVSYDW